MRLEYTDYRSRLRPTSLVTGMILAISVLLTGREALAATYRICVKFQITTSDSRASSDPAPREDHWLNANAGIVVPAYGVHARLLKPGYLSASVATEPATGCYNFVTTLSPPFRLEVLPIATDSAGNSVRIHSDPTNFTASPPLVVSIVTSDFTPVSGGTVNNIQVGGNTPRWTMMASAAFTLFRFHDGIANKQFYIAEASQTGNCGNSSWFGSGGASNNFLQQGRAYIKINSGGECSDSRTSKFLISHEMGHALLRLYTGYREGPWGSNYNYTGGVAGCTNIDGYNMNSVEWGSLGFKEGSADFVSAAVYNNLATTGRYMRFNQEIDLESAVSPDVAGGRLVNVCNIPANNREGLGIRGDWLRFWWDMSTQTSCLMLEPRLAMMNIFRRTLHNHHGVATGASTPRPYTNSTAYSATYNAARQLSATCYEDEYRRQACLNGIDRETGAADNVCYGIILQ